MTVRSSLVLGCAIGTAITSAAFLALAPAPSAPAETKPRGSFPAPERAGVRLSVDNPWSACLTREDLRVELTQLQARLQPTEPVTREREPELTTDRPVATPDATAALAEASRLVDRAILSRRLTEQDLATLSTLAKRLPPGDRIELHRRLIVASNREQIELDVSQLDF